jgi:hypothetical protein
MTNALIQLSWLPDMDLNHDKQIQSLLCYRYTIGQMSALSLVTSGTESRLRQGIVVRERASHPYRHVKGARPLGCRTDEVRASATICPGRNAIRCFCSLKAALLCQVVRLGHGGNDEIFPVRTSERATSQRDRRPSLPRPYALTLSRSNAPSLNHSITPTP